MTRRLVRTGGLLALVAIGCVALIEVTSRPAKPGPRTLAKLSANAPGPRTLAKLRANAPVSAVQGWLVWSVKRPDGWHLTSQHDGRLATPAVAPSPDPFDLDLGTDATGRAVATFSRCSKAPDGARANCRVRAMDLQTGVESDPGVPASAGASDTNPSMWRGRIAFSRYVPGRNPAVEKIYLFAPGTAGLRDLGFGDVGPCRKPNSCTGEDAPSGSVGGIDLGQRRLAYLWFGGGPDSPDDAHEVRVVRLSDAHSSAVASGYSEEVCADAITDTIELSSPVVDGDRVYFAETDTQCYAARSYIVRVDARRKRLTSARTRAVLTSVARADHRLYGLRGTPPRSGDDPTCSARRPCRLQRLSSPRFKRKRTSQSPPEGY